jgi:NAD(P)-dependent dehydrogenase (short-subunit alcohol dehydrogenase family)
MAATPVALITGASRGIGLACAREFGNAGYRLVLVSRTPGELDEIKSARRDEVVSIIGDISRRSTIQHCVRTCLDAYGRVDAVVANAAITLQKRVDETTDDELEYLMAVNVHSLIYLAQEVHVPLGRTHGSMVVIGSKAAITPVRGAAAYVASKAAATQLGRALALDWAPDGIRVNVVCPGSIDTSLLDSYFQTQPDVARARDDLARSIPLGRLGTPKDCSGAVLFLCSAAASFITGVVLPVDGGFTAQ